MLTVSPLVNATLLPLKDKIWIWQNEFYLQIEPSFIYYPVLFITIHCLNLPIYLYLKK